MADVAFSDVSRVHPDGTRAVSHLSLRVEDGELLVIAGPSGCGKTTTLRMVAGLDPIDEGEVAIGGRVVNDLTPGERDVALVAQDQALYPHLDVEENLAFALRVQKLPDAEVSRRVRAEAGVLRLRHLLRRRPRTLSAGDRQAVALGRATTRVPQVFLMDEPLARLDAAQRVRTRAQLAELQRGLGVTMLHVTNDQLEAMALGDRVALLRGGTLQQVGAPQQVYDRPANTFVAQMIGSPPMSLLHGMLDVGAGGGRALLWLGQRPIQLGARLPPLLAAYDGRGVTVGVRPEHVRATSEDDDAGLPTTVRRVERLGFQSLVHCQAPGADEPLVARLPADVGVHAGQRLALRLELGRLHFFDPGSQLAVWHGGD